MPTTTTTATDESPATRTTPPAQAERAAPSDGHAQAPAALPSAPPAPPTHSPRRRWWLWIVGVVVLVILLIVGVPWVIRSLNTVSTDDAYVNGHVTFVAPRVGGQVARVLVDDNNRVHKGDLLVELDKEPYQVKVDIARAALGAAQANLVVAQARARGALGQARSQRFRMERAIEDVDSQIALLKAKVAALHSQEASVARAQADYERGMRLVVTQAISKEQVDLRKEAILVAQSRLEEARQAVYQIRIGLGLPAQPVDGGDIDQVPPNLDQTFSSVLEAQASVIRAAAEIGYYTASFAESPRQMVENFYKQDPKGDVDRIYEQLLKNAPVVKQAEAKLLQAQRDLDQALLDLRYCDVVSEIDGVVTRREVNPGNNVIAGQSVMAVRSLTDIWIDANFKETQLAKLRIGQTADIDVDMYGSRERFKGRISGFTMGTGSTLALLPPENATGNFVKVVQRLPVRIELQD